LQWLNDMSNESEFLKEKRRKIKKKNKGEIK
jgi:hypothetical protein